MVFFFSIASSFTVQIPDIVTEVIANKNWENKNVTN